MKEQPKTSGKKQLLSTVTSSKRSMSSSTSIAATKYMTQNSDDSEFGVELEFNETFVPAHSIVEPAVIVGVAGSALTITTAVSVFVQPPASVPVGAGRLGQFPAAGAGAAAGGTAASGTRSSRMVTRRFFARLASLVLGTTG